MKKKKKPRIGSPPMPQPYSRTKLKGSIREAWQEAKKLKRRLKRLVHKRVLIDMKAVTFLAPDFIPVLSRLLCEAALRGCKLAIYAPSAVVRIKLTRVQGARVSGYKSLLLRSLTS